MLDHSVRTEYVYNPNIILFTGKYEQFPDYRPPSYNYLNKDFESCVLDPLDEECNYITNRDTMEEMDSFVSQIQYFCGHEPICRKFNNPQALKLAQENVENHYKVVGILEKMNITLPIFEHFWPQYFTNANYTYFHEPSVQEYKIKNVMKLPVSQEIRDLVKANLTMEYEFYEFCKRRLEQQFVKVFQLK